MGPSFVEPTTPAVVVVQECVKGHETAYAVDGVSFDEATMGVKVLDPRHVCLWFDCDATEFRKSSIYKSEIRHAG